MENTDSFTSRILNRRTLVVLIPLFLIPLAALTVYLTSMHDRLRVGVREFLWGPNPAWFASALAVLLFLTVIPFLLALPLRGLRYVSELIQGADNRPSTSKIQFLWWTITVLFTFGAFKVRQLQLSSAWDSLDIPPMLLVAMGASALTAVGAKAIATNQADKRQGAPNASPSVGGGAAGGVDPTADTIQLAAAADSPTGPAARSGQDVEKPLPPAGDLRYAVTDDAGRSDFTKIQLLTWTVIAIALYLWQVSKIVLSGKPPTGLPGIDPSLVVLMGLSQGAYMGRKLVPDTTPWLLSLDLKTATASEIGVGKEVRIGGKNFGGTQGGSLVTLNETPMPFQVVSWSGEEIKFILKAQLPPGTTYVGIVAGGQMSANALPLVVIP